MKTLIICINFLVIFISTTLAQNSHNYRIFSTYYGWEVRFSELLKDAAAANVVIIGEEHNDSIAHVFQKDMLVRLANEKGAGNVFLSMEMFERDVQQVMDEYLSGWISEKNFIKESRAWSNYRDYKPLIDFCKDNNIPVICANTPPRYVNMVTRNGLVALKSLPSPTRRAFLPPLPIDTLKGAYAAKFWGLMGDAHSSPQMKYLYQSQNLWDATMAHSILEITAFHPREVVLHLNGRFHSDEYLGVTQRVKKVLSKKGEVITITCVPADQYDPILHKGLADYVILTGTR